MGRPRIQDEWTETKLTGGQKHYRRHKKKVLETVRRWQRLNPKKRKVTRERWLSVNRGSFNAYRAREYARLRSAVIIKFGGRCGRCGFKDSRALQINHKNGNGRKDHKRAYRMYNEILQRSREDLELLCANCNTIHKVENRLGFRK